MTIPGIQTIPEEKLAKRADVAQMTSVHTATDIRIFAKIARSLAGAGYKVILVAPHQHDQKIDNVDIRAVPLPTSRRSRITVTTWRVAKEAYRSGAKVCHFHDPELMPAAILLKLLGRKIIYDVHEDYPETVATKTWLPRLLRTPLALATRATEAFTSCVADRIFAATPAIAHHFPQRKTVVLQNFPIDGELAPVEGEKYADRPPIVAYVGGLTPERGAIEMAQAISLVNGRYEAKLHLAGDLTPSSLREEIIRAAGSERVVPLGFCNRQDVGKLLASSRMGLVLFHSHPNHVNAQPNKLFEYMSAGLPVIASHFPLWCDIVKGANAGIVVDPMNPKAIAKAIEWLLDHPKEAYEMGERGREAVRTKYNWAREEEKLLAAYQELNGAKLVLQE